MYKHLIIENIPPSFSSDDEKSVVYWGNNEDEEDHAVSENLQSISIMGTSEHDISEVESAPETTTRPTPIRLPIVPNQD